MRPRATKGYSVFWRENERRWYVKVQIGGAWRQRALDPALARRETMKAELAGALEAQDLRAKAAADGVPLTKPARPRGATVSDKHGDWIALRERLAQREDIAPATLSNDRHRFNTWILPAFGDRPISGVTVALLRPWARDIADQRAPTTVHGIVSTLKVFLDDAIAEGWCDLRVNPTRDPSFVRSLPDPNTLAGPIKIPVAAAQALLASQLVPLVRRMRYLLAFTLGARAGELAGLTWARVNLTAEVPYVELTEAYRLLSQDGGRGPGRLKTKSSVRRLPLHPLAARVLTWWQAEGWGLCARREPQPADPVLPSMARAGAFSRPDVASDLRVDLAELQLPIAAEGGVDFEFRHARSSFGSWLADCGVPLEVRQKLMGHRGTTVTEASYTAREFAGLAAVVALLPFETVSLEPGPNAFGKPKGRKGRPGPRRRATLAAALDAG